MIKKFLKLSIISLLLFGLCFLVGCKSKQQPIADPIEKQTLYNYYTELKQLRNEVMPEPDTDKLFGQSYISKDLNAKLDQSLNEILDILKNDKATTTAIDDALDKAKELKSKIKSSKKVGDKLTDKDSYVLGLYLLDVSHLPESYRVFYNSYANEKINSLKSLTEFTYEEYNIVRTNLQSLITFMNEDVKGEAKASADFDYCKLKNPFKACLPKLLNLPENNSVFTDSIGNVKNHLKDVLAQDFLGNNISSKVYFKQIADTNTVFTKQFQIAVVDDFGNEAISEEIYTIINSSTNASNPTIVLPKEKEIVSQGKISTTDVRDYVLATDHYGVRIPNEQIDYKVYFASGIECTEEFKTEQTKSPGVYNFYFTARDLFGKTSKTVKKEVIVTPASEDFHSQTARIIANNHLTSSVFTIANIEKLNEFNNLQSKLYFSYGTNFPVAKRVFYEGTSPKATNRNIILIDNIKQYLEGIYQFDGFHNMSYELYPYLEAVVYKNGLGNIQIPERNVINQFHRNGVKIYGYINVPFAHLGGQVKDIELLFAKKDDGSYTNLETLSLLPKKLGFDGWCIDIQTPLYEQDNNISSLPLNQQQAYEKKAAESKAKMQSVIIPFLSSLKSNLEANSQDLLMVAGINDYGSLNESSKYKKAEYEQVSKSVTKFITSPYKKLGPIDIALEINDYKTDLGLNDDDILNKFYKGVITNHLHRNDITIRDYLSFLNDENKLVTSLCLFDLSSKLFSIKLHSNNYQKLDPTSPNNYYGSNNYFEYYKRLQNFIYPDTVTSDSAALARLSQDVDDDAVSTRDKYFALGELVNPRVLETSEFYSSMSSLNGFKHFNKNVEDANFINRKTFFTGGGVNNPDAQGIPLTWTKNNSSSDVKIKPDFQTPTVNGFSSIAVSGRFTNSVFTNEVSLWGLKFVPATTTSIYAGIKINDSAGLNTNYKVAFKLYYIAQDGTTNSITTVAQQANQLLSDVNYKFENDNLDISNISYITKVVLFVESNNPQDANFSLNLMYFYLGNKENFKYSAPSTTIDNIYFDHSKGFTNNIVCNGYIKVGDFDLSVPLTNNQYYFYQEKKDGTKVYLTQSYYGIAYLENIVRYATNPLNPKFPTLDEYDAFAKIVVVYQTPQGDEISKGTVTFDWPNELVKGGYAKVKLSSKIAKVNEAITITPIIDEFTETVKFTFDNSNCIYYKIPGTETYVVKYIKEGFYGFKYETINPYGKDELIVIHGITISNVIEKEADITGDASIDDSEEMKGKKYSSFVNNAERPRYLIDTDHTGGRNLGTKWCSSDKAPGKRWVIIDFRDKVTITRFELAHCACSLTNSFDKGSTQFNSREYEILVSIDGENWKRVVHRENNYKTFTVDILEEPVEAKHIKLNIINGGDDITARVYDMRIFGSR